MQCSTLRKKYPCTSFWLKENACATWQEKKNFLPRAILPTTPPPPPPQKSNGPPLMTVPLKFQLL